MPQVDDVGLTGATGGLPAILGALPDLLSLDSVRNALRERRGKGGKKVRGKSGGRGEQGRVQGGCEWS